MPTPTDSGQTLVFAADLPPAADSLAALFSEAMPSHEEAPAEDAIFVEAAHSQDDSLQGAESATVAAEDTVETGEGGCSELPSTEMLNKISEESNSDAPAAQRSIEFREDPDSKDFDADVPQAADSAEDEALAEDAHSVAPASEEPPEPTALEQPANIEPSAPAPEMIPATIPEASTGTSSGENPSEEPPPSERIEITASSDWAFEEKLAGHREWVDSQGVSGKKADWANLSLEDHELIGINLRFADLHAANLKGADLLLADLRDTCLIRANLQEACLVGANLEGANLEGASLSTSMGLVARQLAGTNLHDAALPAEILEFGALEEFELALGSAFRFFVALMAVCCVSALVIWRTRDLQLITDSGLINIPHLPMANAALPTEEIYLIAPVLIFILYFTFQFHLQRLWSAALELPAVFPDGRQLGQTAPKIIAGLLRAHFRWLDQEGAGTQPVEKIISLLLAYGVAPAVLLLFWARYLTLQDLQGTILQAVLASGAAGMTLYVMTRVGRPQEKWALGGKRSRHFAGKLKKINVAPLAAGFCVLLLLLSIGTIKGIPREKSLAPQFMTFDIRRWGSAVLSIFGLDPYAKLPEASISKAPPNWSWTDDQVASVAGAQLNGRSLRYAGAYGVFLVNAHLFRSNFQGAFLSEADLRGADLGQSNLRLADLDRARMVHSNLNRADLSGANLARADLRDADLSYAFLDGTSLVDAQLGGASFYQARLPFADLTRADLEKSDLRDADLEGANLEHADVQQAYLWSAKLPGAHLRDTQLGGAILIGANLRGADLGGAQLSGTVLNEADLSGTNLAGADLKGSLGLTANQICSAKHRQGALLDDAMQLQVDAQCGAAH